MRLRDLVANSLPRVRGQKKNVLTAAPNFPPDPLTKAANSTSLLDKTQSRLAPSVRSGSYDEALEFQDISEACWQGNALYRGLGGARAMPVNPTRRSNKCTSSRGLVTSHSAEGFSSQLMMTSSSYDSFLAVPGYNESCPQMFTISETYMEPSSLSLQYYHYHRHNHHHYYHHHVSQKPVCPVDQNKLQTHTNECYRTLSGDKHAPEQVKPGFFQKSFAAFGVSRKSSSKVSKETKQDDSEKTVHLFRESDMAPFPRRSSEKRVKPKRKSLKVFSKLKENKEKTISEEKHEKSKSLEKFSRNVGNLSGVEPDLGSYFSGTSSWSHIREPSVESCFPRVFGPRESSAGREIDHKGFDSASLSGYESDLPRTKAHRSRSRIKTNPWLPSPQPSITSETRTKKYELMKSTEEMLKPHHSGKPVPRSSSFDNQLRDKLHFPTTTKAEDDRSSSVNERPRSLTHNDHKMALSLTPLIRPGPSVQKPSWQAVNGESGQVSDSGDPRAQSLQTLNDLSSGAPKSRPSSIVSPNSEFVMLAGNLEQLATNISFEYEDMLDTTLETGPITQEDSQASIQELFTDEENGNAKNPSLNNDGAAANSPDSGIGGLGSTDGDEAFTSTAYKQQKAECRTGMRSTSTVEESVNHCEGDTNAHNSVSSHVTCKAKTKLKNEPNCDSSVELKGSVISVAQRKNFPTKNFVKSSIFSNNINKKENNKALTFSDSDVDNTSNDSIKKTSFYDANKTSYQDVYKTSFQGVNKTSNQDVRNMSVERILDTPKHEEVKKTDVNSHCLESDSCNGVLTQSVADLSVRTSNLMVNERLDIQFQPHHRQAHTGGIIMGTGGVCQVSCVSPRLVARPHPRPCVLRPFAQTRPRLFNDMEKGGCLGQQREAVSTDLNLPRNIAITDSVESPTENWKCDEHFCLGAREEVATIAQEPGELFDEREEEIADREFSNERKCLHAGQRNININDITAWSHLTSKEISQLASHVGCSANSPGEATISEMNDACVQTEFDDDFSTWHEADLLDCLEEKALDPAESTRLWLLSGGMQDSADTGYSSLTRDSLVFMDEDPTILPGGVDGRADRLQEKVTWGFPREELLLDDSSSHETQCADSVRGGGAEKLTRMESGNNQPWKKHAEHSDDRMTRASLVRNYSSPDFHENFGVIAETKPNSSRAIPRGTINRLFSRIESHFHEIYQQGHQNNQNSSARRSSLGGFGQNLTSSVSRHDNNCDLPNLQTDDTNMKYLETEDTNMKDSETGESKNFLDTQKCKNVPSRDPEVEVRSAKKTVKQNSQKDRSLIAASTTRPGIQAQTFDNNIFSNLPIYKTNDSSLEIVLSSERADYLEFLRDAPLNRSNMKRSVFLVPGFGPVDMSCPEQINLFNSSDVSLNKSHFLGGRINSRLAPDMYGANSATKPDMSGHSEDKLKWKGKDSVKHKRPNTEIADNNQPQSANHFSHKPLLFDGRSDSETVALDVSDGEGDPRLSRLKLNTSLQPSLDLGTKTTIEGNKKRDEHTQSLREAVMSLRREKDVIFQKIKEARQEEKLPVEQHVEIQRNLHAQRKEALLETLQVLKHKLEEQSKLLK